MLEVVDGDLSAWNRTLAIARRDLSTPRNYANALIFIDPDTWIDYFLTNFYTGNTDWDHSAHAGVGVGLAPADALACARLDTYVSKKRARRRAGSTDVASLLKHGRSTPRIAASMRRWQRVDGYGRRFERCTRRCASGRGTAGGR